MKQKVLSFCLALVLLLTMLPGGASAATTITIAEEVYLTIGDHISLGEKDGQILSWEIVSVTDNTALLLCDCIVDIVVLESTSYYRYSNSSLKKWCDDFYSSNIFTEEERNAILKTTVDGVEDQSFFVLSKSEFLGYFQDGDGGMRKWIPGLTGEQGAIGYSVVAISDEHPVFWLRSTSLGLSWLDLASYDENGTYHGKSCLWTAYVSATQTGA